MLPFKRIPGIGVAAACAILFAFSANAAHSNPPRPAAADAAQSGAITRSAPLVIADQWDEVPAGSGDTDGGAASDGAAEAVSAAPRRGPADAPVTIVEYSDFQCPYCRAAEPTIRAARRKYGARVSLVYKDFPLSFHRDAMGAALAARCAQEQGQFWAYHDALLGGAAELSPPGLKQLAGQLGLDQASFNTCLDNRKYASVVAADKAEGEQNGVRGTPTLLINGSVISGAPPAAQLDAAIDAGLHPR